MQTTILNQTPTSQLTVTLEMHLGELLAEHERLVQEDRDKAAQIANVVHDLRGSITALNLRLYLLEHSRPEQQTKYLTQLKESVSELTKMAEGLLVETRQNQDD
jgi:signal transduction histidine kinase